MNKVIQLIQDKKAKLEHILYKAKLIPNPSRDIERLIKEYEDECAQLTKAELLLSNKPTGAITEAAHSANTMLGECAASDTNQSIRDGGADSSETAVVGQNEKEKGVCECTGVIHISTDDDNVQWCLSCKRKVD